MKFEMKFEMKFKMKRCDAIFKIDFPTAGCMSIVCQLEKDYKGKHTFEGKSEGKLFKIEWWDELPIIEGLTEMYVEENAVEKGYKK